MVKSINRENGENRGRRYYVFGRALPTEENPTPEVIVVRVFAKNEVFAKSKFWSTNKVLNKIKKSQGEVLKVQEIFESGKVQAKNFGIFLKYRSQTGVHNCFKEFRDVSVKGAINQMYNEMGGNYKANNERVEIVRTVQLKTEDLRVRNPRCRQWTNTSEIVFPVWNKSSRPTHQRYTAISKATRPVCFKSPVTVDK